jgi:tetratricopeptide (TPR) repeat protein
VRNITVDARLMLGKKYMEDKKYNEALKQFLEANVLGDDSQDDSRSGDMRTPQVEYFIGLAYDALGEKDKAKSFFEGSVNKKLQEANYVLFYQGLSYLKLDNKEKANELFNMLIINGEKQINNRDDVNFFAKFGESDSKNELLSQAYLLKGLGYKGLGKLKQSKENLDKATGFSNSNLWAHVEY